MQSLNKAIGVLGGTFDPIHIGHLRMAIEVYEKLKLGRIHVIPCYQPAHRKPPIATPEERLAMLKCAVDNQPALYADSREIDRKGPSYMVETLADLRKEMPNSPLCLLLGVDTFLGLPTWHHFEEILNLAHIIVVPRATSQLPTTGILSELINTYLKAEITYIHENSAGGILQLPIPLLDISASNIRKLIAMGSNPRYLLPDNVYHYIQQHGTYNP
jgi:nicotinate-nucleotide adenylyltransferase